MQPISGAVRLVLVAGISFACFLAGSFCPRAAQASEVTPEVDSANRINYAGRQRMLTQLIARNACFVMAGIDPDRYEGKTETAAQQFETSLIGLRAGNANLGLLPEQDQGVLESLAAVEGLWTTFGPAARQIAAGDLDSVPMRQMIELNMITLARISETLQRIVSLHGRQAVDKDLARTVELAGRQRMLSQKASKEACFFKLGLTFAIDEATMEETFDAFESAMAQLINGDAAQGILAPPTLQIRRQLERTEKVWRGFSSLVRQINGTEGLSPGDNIKLANLSDQVLSEMDLAVLMYTQ